MGFLTCSCCCVSGSVSLMLDVVSEVLLSDVILLSMIYWMLFVLFDAVL